MVSERVYRPIAEESHRIGTFGHGYTYSGHPVAAAVAIETLKIYDERNVVEHARTVGAHMQAELHRRFAGHELVGEVRGTGMIGAVELVEDQGGAPELRPGAEGGASPGKALREAWDDRALFAG